MSGPKAYTMREMKGIVEYLVEHKAYSELKGRKMWMNLSNSSLTTRTWQSLKETFLKRILPDIQNPYYRLTRDQVCSFRQGYDVAEKEKRNRLEIRRSSEECNNDAEKQKNSEQAVVTEKASTSAEKANEVDKTAGEDFQSEKISATNRSSTDTLILENKNRQSKEISSEDLEADPEGPPKTMRDCLGFEESEPPPVVQAVLNDFETDSDGSEEFPMEIVEINGKDANKTKVNDQDVIVVEDSENVELIENDLITVDGDKEVDLGPNLDPEIITEETSKDLVNWLKECAKEVEKQTENNDKTNPEQEPRNTTDVPNEGVISVVNEDSELIVEDSEPIVIENTEKTAENINNNKKSIDNDCSNQNSLSTNDTIIPNNQELLNSQVNQTNELPSQASPKKVAARKKKSSSSEHTEIKKKKLNNGPEKTNGDIETIQPSSNDTETLFEAPKNVETTVDPKTQNTPVIEEPHKNPCLKSVSLFEEQFNTTKYIDSEDEETPIAKNDLKQPDESIVNKNVSKPNEKEESEKFIVLNKPTKDVVIVKSTTPTQDQESQANQSKMDVISKEQDNASMANTQKHDDKELTLKATNETAQNNRKTKKSKTVLVMSSNSDSDEVKQVAENYKERYKRLSQAFGFVPGTSRTAQRRRSFQNRRARLRTISRGHQESSDGDASYTDIDDDEAFVSPPHGRRNRRGRLYKKPESGRIVSLEEEGRLFVIFGNKVYPLVSDGKDLNYVHYDASDCEEESIWRQKYIDQKKKAAELKKQIDQVKSEATTSRHRSPNPASLRDGGGSTENISATSDIKKDSAMNIVQSDNGKIQITLSNNNEEKINLEGHWPQVLPIMQQVMNMFYKPENATAMKENTKVDGTVPSVQEKVDTSGRTTPNIPIDSTSRKVEDLEREIFQEIAERGNSIETEKPEKISNVTKRKARAASSSSEKSTKPAKIARKSKKNVDAKPDPNETDDKTKTVESKTQDKPRETSVPLSISDTSSKGRSPGKDNLKTKSSTKITKKNDAGDKNETKHGEKMAGNEENKATKTLKLPPVEPPVTRSRKSGNETDTSSVSLTKRKVTKPKIDIDEDEVRYMLPPGPKTRKSAAKTPTRTGSPESPHEISQDRFGNSIDSTQGYQDSDATPMKNITKRKKRLSLVVKKGKNFRRKSFSSISLDEASLDSSNSSYFIPKKSFSQPTSDSEIYKTESYRLLMGGQKLSITKLDAIEESYKIDEAGNCNALSRTSNESVVVDGTGSSSVVSLSFSPELSVVENLSVSREMLQNVSHPMINEEQANDSVVSNLYNQYLIADGDVSVPLMQQNDCELLDTPSKKPIKRIKKPKAPAKSPIKLSDFLNKVSSAEINSKSTLSESLDEGLRNLLLESAKKMTNTTKENLMEVDEPATLKQEGKKRCSTPRKRKTKKAKATIGPVIDEHRESCSKSGRQSCPSLSNYSSVIPMDENATNSSDVQLKPKKASRVKKDVIRVKIQRPSKPKEASDNSSEISLYTDSGINESVSINGMLLRNDNVQLIHNHSDTCLQAHECVDNTVEFVRDSNCVINLNSTEPLQTGLNDAMKDFFKEQKNRLVEEESEQKNSDDIFATPTSTAYHSPIDNNNSSLITDDLSDENPSTKWYLLSEEETNTVDTHKQEEITCNASSSNYLKQIFPITCAVPDLSSISEVSKENEDSRKTLDEDTRSNRGLDQ